MCFFFFKQKTAYEMRISDWSSDVCSSDLISGHDPAGGAGIHADLEAVAAQGAHALTVITALTVQDSGNVYRVEPVAAPLLVEQLQRLCADSQIAVVKLGLLGDRKSTRLNSSH